MPKATRFPVLLLCLGFVVAGHVAVAHDTPPPPGQAAAKEGVEIIPPQIIIKTQKAPVYPPAAFKARMGGKVELEFTVLKDGTVAEEVKVLECTHKKMGFEEATIAAIRQWRFEPATADGEPVEFTRTYRLTFHGVGLDASSGPYVSGGRAETPSSNPEKDLSEAPTSYVPPETARRKR